MGKGIRQGNKLSGARNRTILFAVLSLLAACFIFSQSLLSGEESGGLSAKVMAFLRPILDPDGVIPEDVFHFVIRKAAHFTEFAILGVCVGGFTVNLGLLRLRRYVALPLLLTLCVAVCDEFLQYFTGRGSMVTDVVLDYAGSLSALGLIGLSRLMGSRKGK